MAVPLAYSWKNLWVRKLTTVLTAGGMALVVYVFATVLMLTEGLRQTLVATGSDDNIMVIRRGSETEVQSSIDREQAAIIASLPEIALDAEGQRMASRETLVLMALPKKGTGKPSNVTIRGVSAEGLLLRPAVRLVTGRMFRPGSSEIMVGKKIAEGFSGAGLGDRLRFGLREWTIVGLFDAGHTAFASEVWGDAEQLMQAFRRNSYSSVIAKLSDRRSFDAVKQRLETDPRLMMDVKTEPRFYADQSEMLANFLQILGLSLSVIFSLGAIIGAVITMYGAVANRTREIGTLRALGFRRRSILLAFLLESMFLGLLGGVLGIALSSLMQFVTISTMNWQTFSELAFTFTLTPGIGVKALVFSLVMGFLGGVLPATRAARLDIIESLRAA
ncbi:MAG: ABC transporter permease [Methylotetracoccus sp.]|nr:ABC transporter permease [Methylotetracoccus sp.]